MHPVYLLIFVLTHLRFGVCNAAFNLFCCRCCLWAFYIAALIAVFVFMLRFGEAQSYVGSVAIFLESSMICIKKI